MTELQDIRTMITEGLAGLGDGPYPAKITVENLLKRQLSYLDGSDDGGQSTLLGSLGRRSAELGLIPTEGLVLGDGDEAKILALAAPGMAVRITTAGVSYDASGKRHTIATITSVAIATADATNPRIDVVYIPTGSDTVTVLAGTPAGSPAEPALPTNGTKLATVAVAAAAASIADAVITDARRRLGSVGQAGTIRQTMITPVTLAANVIGAATETVHATHTIAAAGLSQAQRELRFKAILRVLTSNGADTWTARVRLGPSATAVGSRALVWSSAAIDIANDNVIRVEGTIWVKTAGAGGKLISEAFGWDPVGAAMVRTALADGTLDTTVAQLLSITGECSSNNAGNTVSLQAFEYELLPAA